MLNGKDQVNFFKNRKNKKELIKLVCSYFQEDEDKALFQIPFIINSSENV